MAAVEAFDPDPSSFAPAVTRQDGETDHDDSAAVLIDTVCDHGIGSVFNTDLFGKFPRRTPRAAHTTYHIVMF